MRLYPEGVEVPKWERAYPDVEAAEFVDAASGARAVMLPSRHLGGQNKYLGGALGGDGVVYGVPGGARTVLRVDPATGTVTTFGGPFPGAFKWLRGITVGGAVYCLPSNAHSLLVIETGESPVAKTVAHECFQGDWMYHGGALAPDGCIYCVPCNATNVLKIVPGPEPQFITFGELPAMRQKWYGGVLAADGAIYCFPNCSDTVLKIIPGDEPEAITFGSVPAGGWKWHGGCLGSDGNVYGIPAHADEVLCIEPGPSPSLRMFGGPIGTGTFRPEGRYKYGGGILAPNGAIYAFPSDADRVLKICPIDSEDPEPVKTIGPSFDTVDNKWQNGFVGRDGNVYAIPLNADGVLQILPRSDEVCTIGSFPGKDKWEGGVEGDDGALYCMPLRAKGVMRIEPGPALAQP